MVCITFPSENPIGDCPGEIHGETNSNKMGLIVLQEWWGMNSQIIERGKDLAERGSFMTVVPDLYRGKVATTFEDADHLAGELDWKGAIKDIQGAARFLLSKGCKKVGVMGFCNGGALSLVAAADRLPEISSATTFYGTPRPHRCNLTDIQIPVQAHFGEDDHIEGFSSPKDARALETKMAGKSFELFMYPAGHAFTNKTSPSYNQKETDIALGRLVKFMHKTLS